MATTRGIKKVSEHILSDGRAIIVTEKNKDNYAWSDIPNGSLFIDTVTGIIQVKVEGENDWIPAGIKNDGTICIAKDTKLVTESYTITKLKDDDDESMFDCIDEEGNTCRFYYDKDGYPIFTLQKGSYQMLRNQMSAIIDGCLYRSAIMGGLEELGETRIKLQENLEVGQIVTLVYSNVVRIGNPYPRIFINPNTPDNSEIGDMWVDTDDTYGDDPNYVEDPDRTKEISWTDIVGKPTTLSGYGITDEIASASHTHTVADIVDFPVTMRANGGNADTVANRKPGTDIGDIPYITATGKLDSSIIPIMASKTLTIIQSDGTFNSYDGSANVQVNLHEAVVSSVFNSRGELVFPNGNRFWLQ